MRKGARLDVARILDTVYSILLLSFHLNTPDTEISFSFSHDYSRGSSGITTFDTSPRQNVAGRNVSGGRDMLDGKYEGRYSGSQ